MILKGTPPPLSEILNKQTSHQNHTFKTMCIHLYKNVLPSLESHLEYGFDLWLKAESFIFGDFLKFSQEIIKR